MAVVHKQALKAASNSPLREIPPDYFPSGSEHWMELSDGPDQGKKLFYYDVQTGQGDPQATVLLVHGNPESSYTYSAVRDQLVAHSDTNIRIVAMDHIGFGLSDQATYQMVDFHHAANLRQLVEHLALQNICLVIHDWGGAIGTGALIDMPERVASLVLMNTTVFPVPTEGLTYNSFPYRFLPWCRLGRWAPWRLWRYIAAAVMYSPAGGGAFARHLASVFGRALTGRLTEGEKVYRDMFSTRANALSSMRNVQQTAVWGHGYQYTDPNQGSQDNSDFYAHIQKQLPVHWGRERKIPARAFFGLWDVLGREEVRQQWVDALPQLNGNIRTYANRGHFVEEHEYGDIAQAILELVSAQG